MGLNKLCETGFQGQIVAKKSLLRESNNTMELMGVDARQVESCTGLNPSLRCLLPASPPVSPLVTACVVPTMKHGTDFVVDTVGDLFRIQDTTEPAF